MTLTLMRHVQYTVCTYIHTYVCTQQATAVQCVCPSVTGHRVCGWRGQLHRVPQPTRLRQGAVSRSKSTLDKRKWFSSLPHTPPPPHPPSSVLETCDLCSLTHSAHILCSGHSQRRGLCTAALTLSQLRNSYNRWVCVHVGIHWYLWCQPCFSAAKSSSWHSAVMRLFSSLQLSRLGEKPQ